MVELHSCLGRVNTSALCSIEEHVVKGERGNVDHIIGQISADLHTERIKNAELMKRISELEAQIRDNENKCLLQDKQDGHRKAPSQSYKESKRRKTSKVDGGPENGQTFGVELASLVGHDYECELPKYKNTEDGMVNWMCIKDRSMSDFENLKDGDNADDFANVDGGKHEDDNYHSGTDTHNAEENSRTSIDVLTNKVQVLASEKSYNGSTLKNAMQTVEAPKVNLCLPEIGQDQDMTKLGEPEKEVGKTEDFKEHAEVRSSGNYACRAGSVSTALHKNFTKVAFCPKEVRRIIEMEALQEKNAQSHTMRKIIVFSSLSINNGCEDMYELDFNHFSILRKGEPFVSLENPGEHVLYENPSVHRKVFYPNRQNPTSCPVQILEEEMAMRPSDHGCPSSLFLCIKYGGRTRNLPQNEYVRQRMGKNKLKSFGPLICKMAMLVHVRSGSFFFKALGITLLFMAGFTDHLIQKETKYRSLDLLQKYYRKDEDAEGEKLFLEHLETSNKQAALKLDQSTTKKVSTKFKHKRHSHAAHKPSNLERSFGYLQSATPSCAPQVGSNGYNFLCTDKALSSKPAIYNYASNVSYPNPTSYNLFPPHQPVNGFLPMMCWPHPSTYAYAFSLSSASYFSAHPHSCYTYPFSHVFSPKIVRGTGKTDAVSDESGCDSGSSSSSS